jgi:alpha-L-fucosidase
MLCASVVKADRSEEKFVHSAPLPAERTDAAILELAANIVPSPRQVAYHEEEFTGFIHFGPNTFTGVEWGNGMEDPATFAPKQVDTDQWCEIMKDAGIKKAIITVKHHDGYCTWQTRYNTEFSIHKSPWKNGKGDVLRLLSNSCKKYGLKLGVYLSPADLFQIESPTGLYGNGSAYEDSVIPTDPASFKTNPTRQRKAPAGAPTFRLETDHYNRYFMNQLYELLTEYGPIHEVWFDGAHPKRKGGQTYMKDEWYKMIRQLAPDAVIFGGPDVRWCGNERGDTRESEWSVLPVSRIAESGVDRPAANVADDASLLANTYKVYGKEYTPGMLMYMVSEVDVSIRHGWFWRNEHEQHVRSADDVFDMYERSVGGNTVFLLNIPPNRDGRFSPRDEKVLREVGRRIRATYDTDVAGGARFNVKNVNDGRTDTFWQPDGETGSFTLQLPAPATVNRVVLQESISKVGQRVKEHALDAFVDGDWQEVATATTIGYKRILRFADLTTDRLRVRIMASRSRPSIATFAAHHYLKPPSPITTAAPPRQGLSPAGWTVLASSEHAGYEAVKAFDGNPNTFWHTSWAQGYPDHPHTLTIDMKRTARITGFTYLPRQDKRMPDSMVEAWRVEGSIDGKAWQVLGEGTFGNILNDPLRRTAEFSRPAAIRFFRFISLRGAQNKPYAGAAEIELLTQ